MEEERDDREEQRRQHVGHGLGALNRETKRNKFIQTCQISAIFFPKVWADWTNLFDEFNGDEDPLPESNEDEEDDEEDDSADDGEGQPGPSQGHHVRAVVGGEVHHEDVALGVRIVLDLKSKKKKKIRLVSSER